MDPQSCPHDWGAVSRMASSRAGRGDRDNVSQQSGRCLDIFPRRQILQIRIFLPQKLLPSSFLPPTQENPSSCLPFPAPRMTWEGEFLEKGLYWTEEQRKSGIKSMWMWSH